MVFDGLEDLAERIDDRRPRRHADRHPGAEECRAAHARPACRRRATCRSRRSWRAPGREGHGADERLPHVRHRLRHHRAAYRARGRGGRPAGAGRDRRPRAAFGEGPPARPAGGGGRAGAPPRRLERRPPRPHAAGTTWCTTRCCRHRRGPTSPSCGPPGSEPLRAAAGPTSRPGTRARACRAATIHARPQPHRRIPSRDDRLAARFPRPPRARLRGGAHQPASSPQKLREFGVRRGA